MLTDLAYGYARAGKRAEALKVIAEMEEVEGRLLAAGRVRRAIWGSWATQPRRLSGCKRAMRRSYLDAACASGKGV